jgi:hypothetical protein
MGKKVCRQTKGTSKHSKKHGPENLPNMWMKVESKETEIYLTFKLKDELNGWILT